MQRPYRTAFGYQVEVNHPLVCRIVPLTHFLRHYPPPYSSSPPALARYNLVPFPPRLALYFTAATH
jgi:hypothetical protein